MDKDLLRTNLFKVTFPYRPHSFDSNKDMDFSYTCKSATFPFFTMETQEYTRNNITKRMAMRADYDPISLEFYLVNDDTHNIIAFLLDWYNIIKNPSTANGTTSNNAINYKQDYVGGIKIAILDHYGTEKIVAYLYNAFPINIENFNMQWGDGEPITITCAFNYDFVIYQFDEVQGYEDWYDYNISEQNIYSGYKENPNMNSKYPEEEQQIYTSKFYMPNPMAMLYEQEDKLAQLMGRQNYYNMKQSLGINMNNLDVIGGKLNSAIGTGMNAISGGFGTTIGSAFSGSAQALGSTGLTGGLTNGVKNAVAGATRSIKI